MTFKHFQGFPALNQTLNQHNGCRRVSDLIEEVEQQVSDDELPVVSRNQVSWAGGQQRLHQAPPRLQRVPLGAQAAADAVSLHHLLQDGVHLLKEKQNDAATKDRVRKIILNIKIKVQNLRWMDR